MGRPSCSKPSNEGTSIAAVAILAGAAVADVKIGPAVARIWHLVIEALVIFMLTAAAAVVTIVITCATAHALRNRRRDRQQILLHPVPSATTDSIQEADSRPGCLACGDTGTVLRAITGSRYQQQPCPQCQPAHRAG
jgi:hypothetical protein